MAIERYGSKTDVVVKLVLVFFVCLLSFSVGTYVGKKFSDNQHKLAEFEPTGHDRAVASVPEAHAEGHAEAEKKSETLSDEEIAKLAEEFVSEDEGRAPAKAGHGEADHKATDKNSAHGETHAATPAAKPAAGGHGEAHAAAPAAPTVAHADPHAAPAAKPANSHDVTAAQAKGVERKIAATTPTHPTSKGLDANMGDKRPLLTAQAAAAGHNQKIGEAAHGSRAAAGAPAKGEAAAVKKPIPTSLPKELAASTLGKFTVQVASYPNESEAKKMSEGLTAQGFSAFYLEADVKGKTYYRVSVGLFPTSKEADAYKADLLSRGKVASAIVQKITK